jgi:glucose/arabinose dehydrogenase
VIRAAATIALLFALLGATDARALGLRPVGTFAQPTYVTSDPGDADRLFVVERKGKVKLVEGGVSSTFANIESVVSCCEIERGLLSIALAPDFDSSGRLYLFYTGKEEAPGEIHVAEMRASGATAPFGSLRNVLTIPHPAESNHYGSQLQFGPDGYLYVSTGDGGGGNDAHLNAQNPKTLLGKILRINPLQQGSQAYSIPADNPFFGDAGKRAEIWSYGLRNPFRFSFDRLTGDLTIGDVGQDLREEVDFAPSPFPGAVGGAGANYGWNCREGSLPGPATDPQCATTPTTDFVDPIFDYSHEPPPGGTAPCAIIGGYVVRDPGLGSLYGRYLYGDLCVGELRSLNLANPAASDRSEGVEAPGLNSFGEDSCGRIYVVEGSGGVYRLANPGQDGCQVGVAPAPQPPAAKPASPTFVGIKAQRRRVERGKAALLTVFVSPCSGRRGQTVELLRNGNRNGSRYLSRACTARFLPRVRSGTTFTAVIREDRGYLPGKSRQLTIRLAHRRR